MIKKTLSTAFLIILALSALAQKQFLQSGPMVAYSTMKEVLLWAQTNEEAKVHFKYWDKKTPDIKYITESVLTLKSEAFIAKATADKLEPGNQYEYELYINDQLVERPYKLKFESQPLWLWRNDAPDFSFASGSCAYINEEKYDRPGEPYGGEYRIFEDIYKKAPNFMLWLGDNVYLREADWHSKTGIFHRFTHTRSLPEMQAMLGSMHQYAIWDDHDYGPDNSDRSYHLKHFTEKTFKLFFPNPNYIFDEGITGFFQWNDCEFFLLDNRFWRTPNNRSDIEEHDILGERQIQWLMDALVNSWATFKFVVVGSQFLNPMQKHEKFAHYAPKERQKIIDKIKELKIEGVIFITGDVHHSELSKLDIDNGYPLYDLTVSPLTAGIYGVGAEENSLNVKGTLVKKRSYAHIKVHGSKEERALEINLYNSDGVREWKYDIKAKDLTFSEKNTN